MVLLYALFVSGRKLNQLLRNQDTGGSQNTWFTRSINKVKRSVTFVDRRKSELYRNCMNFHLVSRWQTRYGKIISSYFRRFIWITERPCCTTLRSFMFRKSEKNLIVSAFTSLFLYAFLSSLFHFSEAFCFLLSV